MAGIMSDISDVNGLVDYINETKPFHSKLVDVQVEYIFGSGEEQQNPDGSSRPTSLENVNVSIDDSLQFGPLSAVTNGLRTRTTLSGIWEIRVTSDGVRPWYRIPAVALPRRSGDRNAYVRTYGTDHVTGDPDLFRVPFNNGMDVIIAGQTLVPGVDYEFENADRSEVRFLNTALKPVAGQEILFNLINIDRIFISLNGVWQEYVLEGYNYVDNSFNQANQAQDAAAWDVEEFDGTPFDEAPPTSDLVSEFQLNPIGKIVIREESPGREYYTFEFYVTPPLGTLITLQIEQYRNTAGWCQTRITESLRFAEAHRFTDTVALTITEPDEDGYDDNGYDEFGFDDYIETPIFQVTDTDPPLSTPAMTFTATTPANITLTNADLTAEWVNAGTDLKQDTARRVYDTRRYCEITVDTLTLGVTELKIGFGGSITTTATPGLTMADCYTNGVGVDLITNTVRINDVYETLINGSTTSYDEYSLGMPAIQTGDVISLLMDGQFGHFELWVNGVKYVEAEVDFIDVNYGVGVLASTSAPSALKLTANFDGSTPFTYTPPTGFVGY